MSDLPREEQPLASLFPKLDVNKEAVVSRSELLAHRETVLSSGTGREQRNVSKRSAHLHEEARCYVPFGTPVRVCGTQYHPNCCEIRSHFPLNGLESANDVVCVEPSEELSYARPDADLRLYEPFVNPKYLLKLDFDRLFASPVSECVEYDLDESDASLLGHIFVRFGVALQPLQFEAAMSLLNLCAASILMRMSVLDLAASDQQDKGDDRACVICNSIEFNDSNAIIFCDGCDIPVHQDCYGAPNIPEGFWFCRRCEAQREQCDLQVRCELCPVVSGAFKQTDKQKWVHMVCALYMPFVRVPKETALLEPIYGVTRVDRHRFSQRCYICNEHKGACLHCARRGCFRTFHASCARLAGLYMFSYENDMSEILLNQNSLPVYCDKHSAEARAGQKDSSITPPTPEEGLRRARELLAAEREKLRAPKPSLFATRKYGNCYWRTPMLKTLVLPEMVVAPVQRALKKRFDLDLSASLVEFLCRYWTIKRDMLNGVMLTKRLSFALEVAALRVVKPTLPETPAESPENMLNAVDRLLELVRRFKRESKQAQSTQAQAAEATQATQAATQDAQAAETEDTNMTTETEIAETETAETETAETETAETETAETETAETEATKITETEDTETTEKAETEVATTEDTAADTATTEAENANTAEKAETGTTGTTETAKTGTTAASENSATTTSTTPSAASENSATSTASTAASSTTPARSHKRKRKQPMPPRYPDGKFMSTGSSNRKRRRLPAPLPPPADLRPRNARPSRASRSSISFN